MLTHYDILYFNYKSLWNGNNIWNVMFIILSNLIINKRFKIFIY